MHHLRAANAKHFTETEREADQVGRRDAAGDKRILSQRSARRKAAFQARLVFASSLSEIVIVQIPVLYSYMEQPPD